MSSWPLRLWSLFVIQNENNVFTTGLFKVAVQTSTCVFTICFDFTRRHGSVVWRALCRIIRRGSVQGGTHCIHYSGPSQAEPGPNSTVFNEKSLNMHGGLCVVRVTVSFGAHRKVDKNCRSIKFLVVSRSHDPAYQCLIGLGQQVCSPIGGLLETLHNTHITAVSPLYVIYWGFQQLVFCLSCCNAASCRPPTQAFVKSSFDL